MTGWLEFVTTSYDHHTMLFDPYNWYVYGFVWGTNIPIWLSLVGGNDPIEIDENIMHYIGALWVCPNAVLHYSGELDDENLSLKMTFIGWSTRI